jgi:hypothetical protein
MTTEQEPSMVEVPETDRDPAPVVGQDVLPEPLTMADGEPMPVPAEGDRRSE